MNLSEVIFNRLKIDIDVLKNIKKEVDNPHTRKFKIEVESPKMEHSIWSTKIILIVEYESTYLYSMNEMINIFTENKVLYEKHIINIEPDLNIIINNNKVNAFGLNFAFILKAMGYNGVVSIDDLDYSMERDIREETEFSDLYFCIREFLLTNEVIYEDDNCSLRRLF